MALEGAARHPQGLDSSPGGSIVLAPAGGRPHDPRMPRRSRVDLAAVAEASPFGVAAVADLLALGIPTSTIARRVKDQRARRLARGVVLLGGGTPNTDQLAAGALAYAGRPSVVSGAEAMRRHGLDAAPDDGHVLALVPTERQRSSSGYVLVERTGRMPDPVVRGGIDVAPLDRAVIDTVRRLDRRDAVLAVLAQSVQRRHTTPSRLAAELAAGSQRGTALPRELLAEVAEGIRSVAEGWAQATHRDGGLPPVLWNPRLLTPNGRFIVSPDAYFPDVGLAWEIDSVAHHFSLDDWDETLRRDALMKKHGVVVAHTRPRRLHTERSLVIDELWGAYRLAASSPTPAIRVERAA
jgi:hypothetical protein